MTLYVKKPIPVEAFQFDLPDPTTWDDLLAFTDNQVVGEDGEYEVYDYLHESWITFKLGDWIIKGIRGEFYPVEESVFAETYEEYEEL